MSPASTTWLTPRAMIPSTATEARTPRRLSTVGEVGRGEREDRRTAARGRPRRAPPGGPATRRSARAGRPWRRAAARARWRPHCLGQSPRHRFARRPRHRCRSPFAAPVAAVHDPLLRGVGARRTRRSGGPRASPARGRTARAAPPSRRRSPAPPCPRGASPSISAWISAFAPTSTPRVGSSSSSTSGSRASALASTTFCWLPPDSRLTGPPSAPLIESRSRSSSTTERSRSPRRRKPPRVSALEDAQGDVVVDGELEHQPFALAVLGDVEDALAHGRAGRAGVEPPRRRSEHLAAVGVAGAEDRLGHLASARRRSARRGRRSRPARTVEVDRLEVGVAPEALGPRARPRRARRSSRSMCSSSSERPTISRTSASRVQLGGVLASRRAAPSRRTVTRSASSKISSRRCEM